MKKLLSVILALVMILSLSTVAFADGVTDPSTPTAPKTYEDMKTVTLTKEYKLANAGTTSPAETFTFSSLTCTGVENAGVGVTTGNAPVPTISSVVYAAGDAGSAKAVQTITITLPEKYAGVGVYTYTFTENDGNTAGVGYRESPIRLVVTVIEGENGKVRVAAVHTESEGGKKNTFDNTYSAGSLSVTKKVTGIMGDKMKDFKVTVTFTAPEGDTVKSDIVRVNPNQSQETISAGDGWTTKTVEFTLKHDETLTLKNIPYGVTYTVVEDNYTDYNTTYEGENGTINAPTANATITNNKEGNVDTGVALDSLPYILLLAVACVGMAVVLTKKRRED